MTRTSTAYSQRPLLDQAGDPVRLFQVGGNWTRTSWEKDPDTGLWLPGVRIEPVGINQCLQSSTLATSPWVLRGTCTVANNTGETTDPKGANTACKVTGLGAVNVNDMYQNIATFTNDADIGTALWMKRISATGKIRIIGNSTSSRWEIDFPTLGTGWNRLTSNHPAVTVVTAWYASATGTCNPQFYRLSGPATLEYYVWNMQMEDEKLFASSDIGPTAAATITRTADSNLIYESGLVNETYQLSVLIPVLIPEHAPSADLELFSIYDNAGAATDHLTLWAKQTTGVLKVTSAATGGSAGLSEGSTDICDGKIHWISASLKPDQLISWTDGLAGNLDHDVDVSDVLDKIALKPSGAWVGGIHVWPKATNRMQKPVQQVTV